MSSLLQYFPLLQYLHQAKNLIPAGILLAPLLFLALMALLELAEAARQDLDVFFFSRYMEQVTKRCLAEHNNRLFVPEERVLDIATWFQQVQRYTERLPCPCGRSSKARCVLCNNKTNLNTILCSYCSWTSTTKKDR